MAPFPSPTVYTPPRELSASDAPLMSHVHRNGSRGEDSRRKSPVHHVQTFVMRNKHSVRAGYSGESDVFWAGPNGAAAGDRAELIGEQVFDLRFSRDGSIRGFVVADVASGKELVKVHYHGDTTSPFDRAFKAFFRR